MIKKVPNYNAWILEKSDYHILWPIANFKWCVILELPLLEVCVKPLLHSKDSNTDYIAVIDLLEVYYNIKDTNKNKVEVEYDLLEAINKTWNEFYETSTRK